MMKQHLEYVYDTREDAEIEAKAFQDYFGYVYRIKEEKSKQGTVRYRLLLDTDQFLMG